MHRSALQESADVTGSQFTRVAEVMELDVTPDPIDVSLTECGDVAARPQGIGERVKRRIEAPHRRGDGGSRVARYSRCAETLRSEEQLARAVVKPSDRLPLPSHRGTGLSLATPPPPTHKASSALTWA